MERFSDFRIQRVVRWMEGLVVALAIVGAGEPPNPVTSGTRHSNGTVSVRAPHDG